MPIRASRILRFTHQSGFWKPRPLAGGAFERTLLLALDWIFVRGPITCEGAEVHSDFHASDHFPISAELHF
jgi:endonuclease/exonuclease/phosphatase family metal-dependent hydrolase